MPDAYTSNKLGLIEPASGSYSGTWDLPLYANWQTIDAAIGGTTSITLSSSNVTLTVPTYPVNPNPPAVSTSSQNLRLYMTGTLSANVTVFLPATIGGFWIADNQTTGAYTVTIKTTTVGSTGVDLSSGDCRIVYSDGTNVKYADGPVPVPVPAGAISAFGMLTAPSGWLVCDGTAYSRTTYSGLFTAIGTTWGIGDGTTTFNVPNLKGAFLRGLDTSGTVDTNGSFSLNGTTANGSNTITGISTTTNIEIGYSITGSGIPASTKVTSIASATSITISNNATASGTVPLTYTRNIGTYEKDRYLNHNHAITDPGHRHTIEGSDRLGSGGSPILGPYVTGADTLYSFTGVSVNTSTTGGTETRSKNYAVQYCIKT